MKIAIQGIAGSFHAQAAARYFGKQAELVECETFRDVFVAVSSGKADRGVVAIENSLHGPINSVYRLLASEQLWICSEVRLKIELFLLAARVLPKVDWLWYEKVLSQAEAISQCEQWLATNFHHAAIEETLDTAASARWVARYREQPAVAIASKAATELYDVKVLAGPINDDPNNYTRFVVLSKQELLDEKADRTSIILTEPDDMPGTLYKALGYFKAANINLSKLDSHPLPGEKRRYAFYVDFDANVFGKVGNNIITKLRADGWDVQILGSYQSDDL